MNKQDIVEQVVSGERSFHKIGEALGENESSKTVVELRRKALEEITGVDLSRFKDYSWDPDNASKNIENVIGIAQVPLGVAGPILVNNRLYYVPLATTEGALIASVNRGCSAINASKGVNAWVYQDEMTRAPAFKFLNIHEVKSFIEWIKLNFDKIKQVAEQTTRHGKLLGFQPFITGNIVFLRFRYSTGDAMGMNMATIATNAIVEFIAKQVKIGQVSLSGNMCVDKKPSGINLILGRGKSVVAEVIIPKKIVELKLKTTPNDFVDTTITKIFVGSARANSIGFNAQVANIVAGIFIATGQDPAHIVEASSAMIFSEVTDEGDLYVSVTIPSLLVGTVGGGTQLPTQQKCLELLGVLGDNKSKTFAEIIAGAILAGEISLISAIANGDLAEAHQDLSR